MPTISKRGRMTSMIVLAAAVMITGSGCEQAKEAINRGGDTPCNDYIGQSRDDQRITAKKYLKSLNGNDPTNDQLNAVMVQIDLLCRAQANASTPIKKADLVGIFSPK